MIKATEDIICQVKLTPSQRHELRNWILKDEELEFNKTMNSSLETITEIVSIMLRDYYVGSESYDYLIDLKEKYPEVLEIYDKCVDVTLPAYLEKYVEEYAREKYSISTKYFYVSSVISNKVVFPIVDRAEKLGINFGRYSHINEEFMEKVKFPETLKETLYSELQKYLIAREDRTHYLDKYEGIRYGSRVTLGQFKTWGDVKKANPRWCEFLMANYLGDSLVKKEIETLVNKKFSKTSEGNPIVNETISRLHELAKHCNLI